MSSASAPGKPELVAGRYALHSRIASGGMASVYFGRMVASGGFARIVAIKRLHPQYATDANFVAAFLDEARLASRVRHPNVVPVLDVVSENNEVWLVMEYVHGEKLSSMLRLSARRSERIPLPIVAALIVGTLHGLHAAHDATSESGEPLNLVHRDVSPQNVIVDKDGLARLVDFGVAKAVGRSQSTRSGEMKGKLAYMAYEQLVGGPVTRQTDVYAASVLLWELLTGVRLFSGDSDGEIYNKIMQHQIRSARAIIADVPPELDNVVTRGLAHGHDRRYATAAEMADAVEAVVRPATPSEVAAWFRRLAGELLEQRSKQLAEIERGATPAPSAVTATRASPDPLDVPIQVEHAASTQFSSISAMQAAAGKERRGMARRVWVAAAALVLVLLGVWAAFGTNKGRPTASAPPAVSEALPPPPNAMSAEPPIAPSAPPPVDTAPSARAVKDRRPTPVKPAPCKVKGPDGIVHIRPECLTK